MELNQITKFFKMLERLSSSIIDHEISVVDIIKYIYKLICMVSKKQRRKKNGAKLSHIIKFYCRSWIPEHSRWENFDLLFKC